MSKHKPLTADGVEIKKGMIVYGVLGNSYIPSVIEGQVERVLVGSIVEDGSDSSWIYLKGDHEPWGPQGLHSNRQSALLIKAEVLEQNARIFRQRAKLLDDAATKIRQQNK